MREQQQNFKVLDELVKSSINRRSFLQNMLISASTVVLVGCGGGRVNTLYSPFSDGQFAESGASRIPSNHQLTLDYVNYFGLSLELFYPTSNDYFRIANNQVDLINATDYIAQPPWQGSVNRSSYRKIEGGMTSLTKCIC